MDAPPVQYVTTSDGFDIAFGVSGSGPPLVFAGTGMSHLQLAWQMPRVRDLLAGLSARFQLVQLDTRGTGLSARGIAEDLSVDDYLRDLETVVDRLGLERFVLYGHSFLPASNCTQYAVRNPERVQALILSGTGRALGAQRTPALFNAFPNEDWDIFLRTIVEVSHKPESPEQAAVMLDIFHQSYEQRNFLLMVAAANRFSLGDLLPQLKTPTLVLNTRTSALVSVEESLKVAQLAKAKFVLLDGLPPTGDVNQALRAIDAFLADLPSSPAPVSGGPAGLSRREVDVLRLLAAGRSNQQIADELVISLNTVRRHVSNIFDKTGVANRTEASVYARDHGIA